MPIIHVDIAKKTMMLKDIQLLKLDEQQLEKIMIKRKKYDDTEKKVNDNI